MPFLSFYKIINTLCHILLFLNHILSILFQIGDVGHYVNDDGVIYQSKGLL